MSFHINSSQQYSLTDITNSLTEREKKALENSWAKIFAEEIFPAIDLLHDCVTDLSGKIAKMMNINPRIKRMDSLMIEANIKNLSRAELLYACVAKLVAYIHKKQRDDLLEGLEHYYNPNDFNQVFYYSDSTGTDERIHSILCDADKLLELCNSDFDDATEYQLLVRCLSEQTIIEDSVRRLRYKEDGGFSSSMLQSPTDPDATYREKAGKEYRGYVANLEESVSENGSVITDYQFEQNTYSDSQFLQDNLQKTDYQEDGSVLVTDGAYCGAENTALAASKNIKLVTTDLTGKDVPDIYADFEFNEEGTRIIKCPAGYSPKSCCCSSSNGHIHASFHKETCMNCPHKNKCKVKEHKKVCSIDISVQQSIEPLRDVI